MSRCLACHRPLTNPASIKHGLGPDCMRKAVAAGTLSIEALEELAAWEKTKPRAVRRKSDPPPPTPCSATMDLFDQARRAAIEALQAATAECAALGVIVKLEIEE